MDKQSLLTFLAVGVVGFCFGGIAALVFAVLLFAAGFLLTVLLRGIVGANLPAGIDHKTDELTLFFLYSAMTRHSSGMPQPMLQGGSDQASYKQMMRRLNQLPAFRLVSDTVAFLGPVVCYPAFYVFNRFTAA